jgi:MFS family permease
LSSPPTPAARPPTAQALTGAPPKPDGYWYVLAIVCLGSLGPTWAMGPIAAILPTIADDLGISVSLTGWVMNAYFLLLVGTVLVMGRLGDLFGHERLFGLGVGVVALASVLCGLANDVVTLFLARGLQGLGAAMVFGTSLAIIAAAVPSRVRGRAIGIYSTTTGVGTLLGVWASTWAVQHLSWQWAFFLPVPLGLLGALLGYRLRLERVRLASRQIDWAGAGLLFATLTAAMLGLNHLHEGAETFEDGGPYHVGMHVLALGFLAAFLKVERRAAAPLLSFKLLHDQRFSAGILGNGIAHMSMLSTAFLVPFLLERGRGLTPTETGQLMMVQQTAMISAALLMGYLYDRLRWSLLGPIGLGSIAFGLLVLSVVGGSAPFPVIVGLSCLLGAGLGGFTTVNNTAIMTLAPQDQRGFASGLIETTRQFGHAIGVSLASSFMAATVVASAPAAWQYVEGFEHATRAMGIIGALGVAVLLWPGLRAARSRPAGVGRERRLADRRSL